MLWEIRGHLVGLPFARTSVVPGRRGPELAETSISTDTAARDEDCGPAANYRRAAQTIRAAWVGR